MLSRFCALRHHVIPTIAAGRSFGQRNFSLDLARFNRYTRNSLRERLNKQKDSFKIVQAQTQKLADSIPLRPPRHLLIALGFTGVSGFLFYNMAAIAEVDRINKERKMAFNGESFFIDLKRFLQGDIDAVQSQPFDIPNAWRNMNRAQVCVLAITALNILVTLMWKIKPLEPVMWRYFTNSFASKSLCPPMLLSVFSHKNLVHLGLNMYVLWNFAPASITKFLGVEQFIALYLTGGVVSSFISLVHKSAIGCPARALGASGAILSLLIYVCAQMPEARLRIIFLPFFDFSAEHAIYGIILFDLIGLLLGYRLFDHAAHLGGSLFGLWYAKYGEEWYRTIIRPSVMRAYLETKKEEEKRPTRRH